MSNNKREADIVALARELYKLRPWQIMPSGTAVGDGFSPHSAIEAAELFYAAVDTRADANANNEAFQKKVMRCQICGAALSGCATCIHLIRTDNFVNKWTQTK